MGRIPEETLEKVKKINIIDYAMNNGYEIRRIGSQFKIKDFGGLFIDAEGEKWNRFSDDSKEAGGGIIQFVKYMDQLDFRKAVEKLIDYASLERPPNQEAIAHIKAAKQVKKEPGVFKVPNRAQNYRRVFAYLTKTRQIDAEIVQYYVKHRKIYQDDHNNCVFCGGDEKGKVRSASLRGTYDVPGKDPFKGLVPNSDKLYPFTYEGKSNRVMVFEAPIDMLSYQSIKKEFGLHSDCQDHYIALNGVAHIGLAHYLESHPDINRVVFCLDNDEPGVKNTAELLNSIEEKYPQKYEFDLKVPTNKDWNQDLRLIHEAKELAKNQEWEEVVELEA
ncbi:DUF3991 and TOPRIM domain-containing protein [Acetobacterium woodii]|uniref:DUF3991 domain-containing protein n=1 Tax=Acetobacterium woodii (strain ATCC 29683 / DSM 1030 / JCM 2381 / KCTC 1655 / WB1) TaxID=931626 RepID=H6LDE1_ACEWD|nr:DUF3991 and TOPRIM domain-containing protein [Acetobacterium woodii]AFA47913.1 hypothetical protein Awo_c11290 [Acetobacterium woodii DSM 1030]